MPTGSLENAIAMRSLTRCYCARIRIRSISSPFTFIKNRSSFRRTGPETVGKFIGRYTRFAARSGKPLFMGEFPVQSREQTNEYIRAIKENRVPLSAFWNFNDTQQDKANSVSFENQRSFVLDLVVSANRQLQQAP